jgi:adenosylmethionine-8-amino-7-oxononanoate aminotransferase
MKKRASKSESWRSRDRAVLWHPFTQHSLWESEEFPVIERADGCWLVDADGRRYLDGVSSLWCNTLGHRRREIDGAMKAQMGRVSHATFLGLTNPPAIELAEELVRRAPKGLERVFYSDNGSTAVEIALKMAFQYWQQNGRPQRTKFVALVEGYHGDTVGAVSVGGIDLFHERFRPLLFPTIKAPTTYAYRCKKASTLEECAAHCLEDLAAILRTHERELCGVVIEPLIQGAGGMIVQPRGFVKSVRELCAKHDVFLVADEVMTGFGRTGTMFACEQEGVTPDLMAVSKGLTGGTLPLAATLATKRIYDGFLGAFKDRRIFFHGHTYTGNPLACAAALGSLRAFDKENVLAKLPAKIEQFRRGLDAIALLPHVGEVRQCGLIAGIELVRARKSGEPYAYEERIGHRVSLAARERGVMLRPLGNVIVLMPPLVISAKDMKTLVEATREAIESVTGT